MNVGRLRAAKLVSKLTKVELKHSSTSNPKPKSHGCAVRLLSKQI